MQVAALHAGVLPACVWNYSFTSGHLSARQPPLSAPPDSLFVVPRSLPFILPSEVSKLTLSRAVQVAAVREGMSAIIPVPLLSLLTAQQLEQLVCGLPEVSVEMLKKLVRYRDVTESHQLVGWFWQSLEEFTNEERVLFLRFVSGRSRLPSNPGDIAQKFQIIKVDRVRFKISHSRTLPLAHETWEWQCTSRYNQEQRWAVFLTGGLRHTKGLDIWAAADGCSVLVVHLIGEKKITGFVENILMSVVSETYISDIKEIYSMFSLSHIVPTIRSVGGAAPLIGRPCPAELTTPHSFFLSQPVNGLPTAQTCFFLLRLPPYTSQAILAERLRYSIHNCPSIDMDNYMLTHNTEPADSSDTEDWLNEGEGS